MRGSVLAALAVAAVRPAFEFVGWRWGGNVSGGVHDGRHFTESGR